MAGDTPTPLRDNKEGTPFHDGDGLEFRMASDFSLPYEVVDERRRVHDSFAPHVATNEAASNVVELKFPPTAPNEIPALTKQIIAARVYVMEPSDTPFFRDEAA